jgi:hypothetical protein
MTKYSVRRSAFVIACICLAQCGGDGPSGASATAEGTGLDSLDGSTSGGMTSATGMTASSTSPDTDTAPATTEAGDTGAKFDVGQVGETGETETDTAPVGPGSCRASESYGAAGGFPAFADPAYAGFTGAVLLMTSDDIYWNEPYALRVIDISGDPPPPNLSYAAPIYHDPSWTPANFGGGIFGLTLDSFGNIYVAASRIYGAIQAPGRIYRVDGVTGQISTFADLPNTGPAFGNINYDCNSETIYVVSHEDCRVYQLEMNGSIRSTYHHGTGDVTMGAPADPNEPDGLFCPLGDRMWAVQSHYGRLYYSVWWEDSGRQDPAHENEIWSVAYVDDSGVPDPTTAELEATVPGLQNNTYSNPVSDISFAATGWMLGAERSMHGDDQTGAHQSTTYEFQQMGGTWQVIGTTYVVGELPNSSAGGVDHDFEEGGYVWMTGDALDFYTDDVVYGVQGTPYGGGTIENSTLIDHDAEIVNQDKHALGDCEIPIPGDAMPPPPPPEG